MFTTVPYTNYTRAHLNVARKRNVWACAVTCAPAKVTVLRTVRIYTCSWWPSMPAHGAIGTGLDGSPAVVRVTIGTAPQKLHGTKAYKASTAARAEALGGRYIT